MNFSATAHALESGLLDHWEVGETLPSAEYSLKVGLGQFRPGGAVSVPIDSAARNGRVLVAVRPINVSIERSEGGFCAENITLQIFAAGENAQQALADFRSQLFELYAHYSKLTEDEVVGEGARLRELFVENFRVR